ncbi:sugar ABC transporter substrate-binding protein [Saccharopolyspora erythraea]|uniref:ABC transporter substrate-binding protein n=1 Tax=Saccharopolyspora erythraea TaxID=1836 RepID=UPI001BA9A965|nr:sugar ABC transporter substrate-binding protein [Saccharopolyspora erythraea]QUH01995.1 sugar ABC transporter substrate-binding protein [Saccharopolyspora erythraea]
MRIGRALSVLGTAVLPLVLTGCVGAGTTEGAYGAEGMVRYAMWDADQLPAYQECEQVFERKHPHIQITIEQTGYDDYWNNLMNALVAGTAPDAFANHASKYPQLAKLDQLEPLNGLIQRDQVRTDQYLPGLAEAWVGPDGSRYGLPKDFDTVALVYNRKMARAAGLSDQDMSHLTWNPQDGGTFEKAIARMTVDDKGVRGDQPGFDKNHVKTHGLGLDDTTGEAHGQTQWSHYAVTNGWQHLDRNPWGTHYNLDDPRFVETIQWWRSLIDKGYLPTVEQAKSGIGMTEQFAAESHAMATDGSWTAKSYHELDGVDTALAPLPTGPNGKRASMLNGLADSVWAGSKKKEAAWQWVKFLGSAECQNIVAKHAVVLPAIPESLEIAKGRFAEQGIDLKAFTDHVDNGTTFQYPITDHAADIEKIMEPAMDSVMLGKTQAGPTLRDANEQVNELFQH